MRAAVFVTDPQTAPETWPPLVTMLRETCEDHVALISQPVSLSPDAPVRLIDRDDELTSLKEALVWSRDEPVLFIASDFAAPSSELARYMEFVRAGHDAVVPCSNGGSPEPLFAIYTQACMAHINSALLSDRHFIADILDELNVRYIDESEVAKFGEPSAMFSRRG